jgi:hypothetical protein
MTGVQFLVGGGKGIYLSTTTSRLALGPTQLPIKRVTRTPLEVKHLECETDHLPPHTAKVKNLWSCISNPQYVSMALCLIKYRISFMVWYLVNQRDNCTLCAVFVMVFEISATACLLYYYFISLSAIRNFQVHGRNLVL